MIKKEITKKLAKDNYFTQKNNIPAAAGNNHLPLAAESNIVLISSTRLSGVNRSVRLSGSAARRSHSAIEP